MLSFDEGMDDLGLDTFDSPIAPVSPMITALPTTPTTAPAATFPNSTQMPLPPAPPTSPTIAPLPTTPAPTPIYPTPSPTTTLPIASSAPTFSTPIQSPVPSVPTATYPTPSYQTPMPTSVTSPAPIYSTQAPTNIQAPAFAPLPAAPATAPTPGSTYPAPAPTAAFPSTTPGPALPTASPYYPAPAAPGAFPAAVPNMQPMQPVAPIAPIVNPRIGEIKAIIDSKKNDFSKLTKLCTEALGLLSTFPAEEQNTNNPNSLLSKMKSFIPYLYSQRANKSFDEINNLKSFFGQAQTNSMLGSEIKKEWISTLNTLSLILMANNKKNSQSQAQDYQAVFNALSQETDPFEISLAANGLTNLFVNREKYDLSTLTALKNLLETANSENLKQKNIFSPNKFNRWQQWKDIVTTNLALKVVPEAPLTAISTIEQHLSKLSLNEAHHEQRILINVISSIFNDRGNMTHTTLKAFKNLLIKIKKQKRLLSNRQLKILTRWLQELQLGLSLTSKPQLTYIEGLIAKGIADGNLGLIAKGANLFTAETPKRVKNKLITQVNNLLAQQQDSPEQTHDRKRIKELIRLLRFVRSKTIKGKGLLLNENQQKGIDEWIKRLKEQKQKKADYNFTEEPLSEDKEKNE